MQHRTPTQINFQTVRHWISDLRGSQNCVYLQVATLEVANFSMWTKFIKTKEAVLEISLRTRVNIISYILDGEMKNHKNWSNHWPSVG